MVVHPDRLGIVRRSWKFTASFSEQHANRVVLKRQVFYVRRGGEKAGGAYIRFLGALKKYQEKSNRGRVSYAPMMYATRRSEVMASHCQ
jgi:hypothetical protein